MRLFLLEGQAAIYDDDGTARNGMARLGALLARDTPNTPTSFTLADTHLLFPQRLYNSFETPIKLIKARRCRARARACLTCMHTRAHTPHTDMRHALAQACICTHATRMRMRRCARRCRRC